MRHAVFVILLAFTCSGVVAQNNIAFSAGVAYTNGVPTFIPGARGSRIAVDTVTMLWYESLNPSTAQWIQSGYKVQPIAGCATPAYIPNKHQSPLVINACSPAEIYQHEGGGVWACLNCGGGGGGSIVTDATLTGSGTSGNPLSIASQSASAAQVLTWSGTAWIPSWGNPYTYVTATSSVTTAVNTILVGTLSANITIGLPTCSLINDSKEFEIKKNGADNFGVTVDPAGTELFADGAATKTIYNNLNINCVCRFSGGTGTWYFTNF